MKTVVVQYETKPDRADENQALIERVFPEHAAKVAELVGVLTQAEQEELARLCKKLGLALAGDV